MADRRSVDCPQDGLTKVSMGNTAAIYVRRSAADERDADESDRSGWGPLVGTPWDSTSSSENAPTE